MKIKVRDLQLENLTKYVFKAPSWWVSLLLIAVAGVLIELIIHLTSSAPAGIGIAIAIPQMIAVLTTVPLTSNCYQKFTWNRAGLLGLASTLFTLPFLLLALIPVFDLLFAYIAAAGFTLSLRLFILTAVVDYHTPKIAFAAVLPSIFQFAAVFIIGGAFSLIPAGVSFVLFYVVTILYLRQFDKPLKRGTGLIAMQFVNVYIGHITNGTNEMESYLRTISESATVPETTFFFKRDGKKDIWFVVPNLHPGPLADIGGSNFPNLLYNEFKDEATVLVSHGCASHDLNLISNNETVKIADAIRKSKAEEETFEGFYSKGASTPVRSRFGSVSVLSQKFGDSLLMVTTRSPEMTEDMDYSLGRIVMGDAKAHYRHVGFVDAHNCMLKESKIIYPSTVIGNEYLSGAANAIKRMADAELLPISAGVCQIALPFDRAHGFGDTGLIAFVVKAGDTKTAYILFDGNNVKAGTRDVLRDAVLAKGFDECEIMTTDSHVVNLFSGTNPVGMAVSAEELVPFVLDAVEKADADVSPAEVGTACGECCDVQVFGPGKFLQLTSFVSSIVVNLMPFYILFLLTAILSVAFIWVLL